VAETRDPTISAVIPALDESALIAGTVRLLARECFEVIVVDGGSQDDTVRRSCAAGATAVLVPGSNRAAALNAGAHLARGDVLYFIHADCRPPLGFATDIRAAIGRGASAGCFRLRFDSDHPLLRASGWFTRFNIDLFRFGDQSLFVRKPLLERCPFNERMSVLEDQDIIRRLRRNARFEVLEPTVTVSPRAYVTHGLYRTQLVTYPTTIAAYRLGASPPQLDRLYRRLLGANRDP
jgi:glycosyltransferase involved in cell wall biosynthesis